MQQKISILRNLFIAISFFTACTSNENKKSETTTEKTATPTLDGAWEIVRAEGSSVKSNLGTVYTFDGDKLTMGKNGFNNPGKTEITESTFSFQNDATNYKFMYDYKFNGDTLVVVVQNSNGQTFYMVKK